MLCLASTSCGGNGNALETGTTPENGGEAAARTAADFRCDVATDTYLTGSAARAKAGPIGAPQGLDDLAYGIAPWGPVVATHTITLPGQEEVHVINQLASPDPFTAMYQLEDGTLVLTNDPVEYLVLEIDSPEPDEIQWTDTDSQTWNVYDDEVVVLFLSTTTEQQIWNLINTYNLEVRMSWFEPAGGGSGDSGDGGLSGNDNAWFQFGFDYQVWPTLDAALAFFNTSPLVDLATPSFTDAFEGEYAYPHWTTGVHDPLYDKYYPNTPPAGIKWPWTKTDTMFITVFGIDTNPYIMLPCDYGYNTDSIIAVIDTGVWRGHPDLQGALTPVGIDCRGNNIKGGIGLGQPDTFNPVWASHGTAVTGQINAVTNNDEGVASIAPRAKVLPIRLDTKNGPQDVVPRYGYTSMVKAIRGLALWFPKWQTSPAWDFDVKIVNMSISSTGTPQLTREWKGLHNNITRDVNMWDRLYTASAGNEASDIRVYPAAYPEVLGVTGLWYDAGFPGHWRNTDDDGQGSNYWSVDARVYPISGMYGCISCSMYLPVSFPVLGRGFYSECSGTSFTSPQIAALAFDLWDVFPTLNHQQVITRILNARDDDTARGYIAGVPDFMHAFQQQ